VIQVAEYTSERYVSISASQLGSDVESIISTCSEAQKGKLQIDQDTATEGWMSGMSHLRKVLSVSETYHTDLRKVLY
jgi:hypothetical protein